VVPVLPKGLVDSVLPKDLADPALPMGLVDQEFPRDLLDRGSQSFCYLPRKVAKWAKRKKPTDSACTEALSEDEKVRRRERAEDNAAGVRVEREVGRRWELTFTASLYVDCR
jgi:hypothetical protein